MLEMYCETLKQTVPAYSSSQSNTAGAFQVGVLDHPPYSPDIDLSKCICLPT
jgi:hypothetical protein